jgi:hypothetical protein
VASHDERSSATRSRTRKAHTPSRELPLRAGSVEPGVLRASRCSAAVCTSNSPYTSARTNVERTSSTRTPILWKQSGTGGRVGAGSTSVVGGGAARRVSWAPTLSVLPAGSVAVARARHHALLPWAGAGPPSGLTPPCACVCPCAVPAVTRPSKPLRLSSATRPSRRRSLSARLRACCPGVVSPSNDAHPSTVHVTPPPARGRGAW